MIFFVSECKNCNYKTFSFRKISKDVCCPKCGKKELETTSEKSTSFTPEFIIPQTTDKKTFLKIALDYMKEHNVPAEAYKNIDPSKITKYYIPAFGFQGSIDAKWKCEYNGSTEITINNLNKNILPGTPMSGEISGYNFEAFLMGASAGQNKDDIWAEKFAFPIPTDKATKIDDISKLDNDAFTFLPSDDSLKVWNDKGQSLCDYIAQQQAEINISNPIALWASLGIISQADATMLYNQMGQHMGNSTPPTRNWDIYSRSNLAQKPIDALIPVWYLSFKFENNTYYIAATAENNNGITCLLPSSSQSSEDIIENDAIIDAKKKSKYTKLAGFLAIPLFFIANFIVALIFLVAWFAAYKYFDKQVNNLKKAELDKNTANIDNEIRLVLSKLK